MGNYITAALLEERITTARLTQLCQVTGSDKTALLNNVIERAEAQIDSPLSKVYITPVANNCLCEEWALTLAEYELYKRSSWSDLPQKIKDGYKNVMDRLTAVGNGKENLPVTTTLATVETGGIGAPMFLGDDNSYTSSDMKGF